MKFADIPQMTRMGNYAVNVGWKYLEEQLTEYGKDSRCPLIMDPEFQRGHVWSESKQRAYVEYKLRGGPAANVILWNCKGWMGSFVGPMYLVDGKQRIEAVRKFMRNELAIFGGSYFNDFEDTIRLTGTDFVFNVNNLHTYAEVLQMYIDFNSGGVVHTDDEIERVRGLLADEKARFKKA